MFNRVPAVSVTELAAMADQRPYLIDVREPGEQRTGRIPWAVPMPMATVPARLSELSARSRVYVVCASGGRSARITKFLIKNGVDAVNVRGGTSAWKAAGHATR